MAPLSSSVLARGVDGNQRGPLSGVVVEPEVVLEPLGPEVLEPLTPVRDVPVSPAVGAFWLRVVSVVLAAVPEFPALAARSRFMVEQPPSATASVSAPAAHVVIIRDVIGVILHEGHASRPPSPHKLPELRTFRNGIK